MVTAQLTPVEAAMRACACTRCKAKPGDPCVTATGRTATSDHTARYFAARRAGRLQYDPLRGVTAS